MVPLVTALVQEAAAPTFRPNSVPFAEALLSAPFACAFRCRAHDPRRLGAVSAAQPTCGADVLRTCAAAVRRRAPAAARRVGPASRGRRAARPGSWIDSGGRAAGRADRWPFGGDRAHGRRR
eukprot:7290363-Prymnesium_polylepis.1